jgi:hypothetical protein
MVPITTVNELDAIVKECCNTAVRAIFTKEPTDINKLADEYLRLAYHVS